MYRSERYIPSLGVPADDRSPARIRLAARPRTIALPAQPSTCRDRSSSARTAHRPHEDKESLSRGAVEGRAPSRRDRSSAGPTCRSFVGEDPSRGGAARRHRARQILVGRRSGSAATGARVLRPDEPGSCPTSYGSHVLGRLVPDNPPSTWRFCGAPVQPLGGSYGWGCTGAKPALHYGTSCYASEPKSVNAEFSPFLALVRKNNSG